MSITEIPYSEFLEKKAIVHVPTGIESVPEIHPNLFPFQRDIVSWALRKGRIALLEDTGLGKTIQELEFARHVERHTKRPVLVLTPLAVAPQMRSEGKKLLGLDCVIAASDSDIKDRGIYITNYHKLHKFDPSKFGGVVADEASILKSLDGATARMLIESFRGTPFRMCATATPSPNNTTEIGAYAEFLGVMSNSEMLSTFFVHDGGETQSWRLKGHAESDFWRWMASWSVCVNKPSNLGYSDEGYDLPPLRTYEHVVEAGLRIEGELFAFNAETLTDRREARRASISHRIQKAFDLIAEDKNREPWCVWCNLNSEQDAMAKLLGDKCYSIQGSNTDDEKEEMMAAWIRGDRPYMISKPSIFGYGLNLQFCRKTIFLGLSDSFEQYYQAVRRFYRFGQKQEVHAHVIISDSEGAVLRNIRRKEKDARDMQQNLVAHMAEISSREIRGTSRMKLDYNPTKIMQIPEWLQTSI